MPLRREPERRGCKYTKQPKQKKLKMGGDEVDGMEDRREEGRKYRLHGQTRAG
jgi:hypothetical protein